MKQYSSYKKEQTVSFKQHDNKLIKKKVSKKPEPETVNCDFWEEVLTGKSSIAIDSNPQVNAMKLVTCFSGAQLNSYSLCYFLYEPEKVWNKWEGLKNLRGVDSRVILDGRCNSKFILIFHSIFLSKSSNQKNPFANC